MVQSKLETSKPNQNCNWQTFRRNFHFAVAAVARRQNLIVQAEEKDENTKKRWGNGDILL